jgi:hypothetical protein
MSEDMPELTAFFSSGSLVDALFFISSYSIS